MTSEGNKIEAEMDMGDLLDSLDAMKPLRRGDVVEGLVMRVDPEGVMLNVGHKAEGIVPTGEMRTLGVGDTGKKLSVGDKVVAFVLKGEGAEGTITLSIDKAAGETGWRVLEEALKSGEDVTGSILGFNRGGAIVEVQGVQCFVPMSQLVTVSRDNFAGLIGPGRDDDESKLDANPDEKIKPSEPQDIGKELVLRVLEVNRGRNRAILSERQAVQAQRDVSKAKLIEDLKEGEVRKGKVTGISSFGVFVDLGGADGLVHISELSWTPVNSPEEIVRVGDQVDVLVLRVDVENQKIALSLKRLQKEPWETIEESFRVGDVVDATITKLTDFGAFARVTGSVEGLVHISELSSRVVQHPKDVVSEGDTIRLKVLRIEAERRRLGLSLKQAIEDEEA